MRLAEMNRLARQTNAQGVTHKSHVPKNDTDAPPGNTVNQSKRIGTRAQGNEVVGGREGEVWNQEFPR